MGLLIGGTALIWGFNNALFNGTKRAWSYEMDETKNYCS
jgi:hypothetical protein